MADKKDESEKPRSEKSRKKWVRPALRTGKLFEMNSLACGKSSPITQSCFNNPTNS